MDQVTAAPATSNRTEFIDLAKVDLPDDARLHDPLKVESLSQDMLKNGQLQEIIVMGREGRYEVVAGVGRVLAARKLGWSQLRAQVRAGLSDFEKSAITFSENEHREDTDPVYQGYLLEKMLKARSCNQKELAAAVGLPEARVSEYLTIAALNPEILKKLQRCNFSRAHMLEISRLPTSEQQTAVADKCQKGDLSLRELKVLINQILSKPDNPESAAKSPAQEPGPDPLSRIWEPLLMQAMASGKQWGVSYGPKALPGMKGVSLPAWQFWVANTGPAPKAELRRWFQQMLDALDEAQPDEQTAEFNVEEWATKYPDAAAKFKADYEQGVKQAAKDAARENAEGGTRNPADEVSEEEQIRMAEEFIAKHPGRIG